MHRDAESDRDEIKQDRYRRGNDAKFGERHADNHSADRGINHTVEAELFRRNGELAVDRQDEERVELSSAHQLRNGGDVGEKECLEKLRDHLVGAEEQDHFPFCPTTEAIDVAEDDLEKN